MLLVSKCPLCICTRFGATYCPHYQGSLRSMLAACRLHFSETSTKVYQTTRRHNWEHNTPHVTTLRTSGPTTENNSLTDPYFGQYSPFQFLSTRMFRNLVLFPSSCDKIKQEILHRWATGSLGFETCSAKRPNEIGFLAINPECYSGHY
jgi:hypothetical protein